MQFHRNRGKLDSLHRSLVTRREQFNSEKERNLICSLCAKIQACWINTTCWTGILVPSLLCANGADAVNRSLHSFLLELGIREIFPLKELVHVLYYSLYVKSNTALLFTRLMHTAILTANSKIKSRICTVYCMYCGTDGHLLRNNNAFQLEDGLNFWIVFRLTTKTQHSNDPTCESCVLRTSHLKTTSNDMKLQQPPLFFPRDFGGWLQRLRCHSVTSLAVVMISFWNDRSWNCAIKPAPEKCSSSFQRCWIRPRSGQPSSPKPSLFYRPGFVHKDIVMLTLLSKNIPWLYEWIFRNTWSVSYASTSTPVEFSMRWFIAASSSLSVCFSMTHISKLCYFDLHLWLSLSVSDVSPAHKHMLTY